ncbi:MAG TPA: hypothetical protein VIL46_00920 [Gemmataceae bacterium]
MRRIEAVGAYFEALAEGDPIALGLTALFGLVVVVVALVAWRARADERRWEEKRRKRWGAR